MILNPEKEQLIAKASWQSPSNIAIVKYWGKFPGQIPANPSLSFTLSQSFTQTRVRLFPKRDRKFSFLFDGKPAPAFHAKLQNFFEHTHDIFPFTKDFFFEIESKNNFPHSAGIASSASAMSALALCFCSLEQQQAGGKKDNAEFFKKASWAARLGSGSASRSVFGPVVSWGETDKLEGSSNFQATRINGIHENFSAINDRILLISSSQKSVSSTKGHQLMFENPYADVRFREAKNNHAQLIEILRSGDWEAFISLCEHEALSLHAMMLLSKPGYFLFESGTLEVIRKIRHFRDENKLPMAFTLDAGPNIHLLYPADYENIIIEFLNNTFPSLFSERKLIFDSVGNGPVELTDDDE